LFCTKLTKQEKALPHIIKNKKKMGYHNKLPESLQEVDVIIAGGTLT